VHVLELVLELLAVPVALVKLLAMPVVCARAETVRSASNAAKNWVAGQRIVEEGGE